MKEKISKNIQCSNDIKDIGFAQIDLDRQNRTGMAEVIFGLSKTKEQIFEITKELVCNKSNVLITRIDEQKANFIKEKFPKFVYEPQGKIGYLIVKKQKKINKTICVVCAGTSDIFVAKEASMTANFYGFNVEEIYDCGVAGLSRLLKALPKIKSANIVIAVAGMEGALPSVLAGLIKAPVVAVPTSVGYGANFGGITALLAMINSCASGIAVVNIDNGFGAAHFAAKALQK